ncbi:DNA methylase [Cellulophaga phage phi12:1]|uniref:site-specific DNA-methyltransferase (adenine-specific) n=2 Tax=Cellulophaga phage phi12:1 TaxID=1327976 RepID=R9ZXX8_9CAUD|nr:DNA methyltransferase [Cellulophaga phage phi12:1]AGO47991.1 DNA methylase [Cellulophaga phage phi12:1]AGO48156.1 DNA methylase [Cellulophaga phage phi12:3]
MKYMGSKNRIAKQLLEVILPHRLPGMTWVEPMVGGANMIDKVDGERIGADSNKYLISLLNEMTKPGFKSPEINEKKYKDIKDNKDNYPLWVVGYAGFQLSFGGKWFGGYRRDKQGKRNYCKEAQNNVNKQSKNIQGVDFIHTRYQDLEIPKNSLIYCDPPYEGTTKYKDDFNHSEFWEWCRVKTKEGHKVFISEYNAPDDFKCIWQNEITNSINNKKAVEKLFIFEV